MQLESLSHTGRVEITNEIDVSFIFDNINLADIYFDFNPAITTNTVNTEIVVPLSIGEFNTQSIQLFPNPVKDKLEMTSNQIIDRLTVIDINGRVLHNIILSNLEYNIDVSKLTKGVSFLEVQSGESKSKKKFIKN
jgi:hypothetical protein